ncbi:MAG: hypothetical protein JSU70_07725 [Phycisphaerales bacterium]|nr:MAG: hypothetical protein JSU70_07725 [Phycisphaerales bacterium]
MGKASSYEAGLREVQEAPKWPVPDDGFVVPDEDRGELDTVEYLRGEVECLKQAVVSHEVRLATLLESVKKGGE